ncbi:hypothetical protein FOFC_07562 [Fusarium oxysporum]|nr:hypothetical protein FOFC_07562 [Fusarium oxysporum]
MSRKLLYNIGIGLRVSTFLAECDVLENSEFTFEQAVSQCRYPLRGLVHCAGIGWVGDTIDFKIEEARQIIDVNLMGTWICAQAAVQLIQKHNLPASFVFIGTPTAAYSASKTGVHQLTRSLASEWGGSPNIPEIRVNSVSPGIIRTPMTADVLASGSLEEVFTENTMLKRLSQLRGGYRSESNGKHIQNKTTLMKTGT